MAKGAATTMRSRRMAMGLVLLRTTTTLAWIQSFRVNRWISLKVTKSGFQSTTLAASVSPFSSTNPERASKTTETATAIATDSNDANGHPRVKNKRTGMGRKSIDVSNVQPLLQKHMEDLAARNRRTVKARQHVNPLAATFQQPVDLPKRWFESAFEKPNAPLTVDIGCAKGTFLMGMAKAHPNRNFLGLEIRRPIAAVGLARAAELGTRNCHLVCCNANVDLDVVLTDAIRDGASIDAICIHFPDPHFKAKHYKRRILQPELVACIERHLQPEGIFFMQSDVLDVLQDMRVITRETAALLEDTRPDMEDWMEGPDQNPFGLTTSRIGGCRRCAQCAECSDREGKGYLPKGIAGGK